MELVEIRRPELELGCSQSAQFPAVIPARGLGSDFCQPAAWLRDEFEVGCRVGIPNYRDSEFHAEVADVV